MKLYALRKPARPILYTLLLVLITVAALVFSLQALLDSLVLKNATEQYAYIVSPYRFETETPLMDPLDPEITERLKQDENVSAFQQTVLRAGKLRGTYTVPDDMMTTEAIHQHYYLTGVVENPAGETPQGNGVCVDRYYFSIRGGTGHSHIPKNSGVTLTYTRSEGEPKLERNRIIFIVADQVRDQYGIPNKSIAFTTTEAAKILGYEEGYCEALLRKNGCIVAPAELSYDEAMSYLSEKKRELGLKPFLKIYNQLENAVTVRYVSDMNLITNAAKGSFYADWGRFITPEDAGKKVCVVSNGLITRNQLTLGDTIWIAVADGHYTIPEGRKGAGFESGYPMEGEEFLPYGEYEEYTVIGSYYQKGRDKNDPRFHSVNDIFIPLPAEGMEEDFARPYTLSVQVPGNQYDAFLAQNQPNLEAMGYRLRTVDQGWEDVADSFYAMADRRVLIFLSALLCFLAGALSFGGLIFHCYKQDYGLCRQMGAYRREAGRVLSGGFWLSALPGAVLSVAVSWGVYLLWMKDAVLKETPISLPGTWECLAILSGLTAAELLLSALFVRILRWRYEKKGILQMH